MLSCGGSVNCSNLCGYGFYFSVLMSKPQGRYEKTDKSNLPGISSCPSAAFTFI